MLLPLCVRVLLQALVSFVHRPPRRARTRWRVAPPSSWYSLAVLSSFLYTQNSSVACPLSFDFGPRERFHTYICLPPKMRRCCAGGMPSFSSTRSLMRETCGWRFVSQCPVFLKRVDRPGLVCRSRGSDAIAYFVVGLNVKLDLLAGQGAHSTG